MANIDGGVADDLGVGGGSSVGQRRNHVLLPIDGVGRAKGAQRGGVAQKGGRVAWFGAQCLVARA